ncbi:flagellar biosynthesis anti-sigma factor FlgM [Vagococcus sp. DIV0080]|uniref:Negative regulator of flagellin synthesis n=1 Tax=Candidatus Vagococcus giribetii TaxID=2230876 RepID=A0ABS3HTG7_9ENTE|nr:flagellar biosynthesis anti-sigma factor FlgM [Vagococcus sp. DIV0080]MBO0476951.1 flagellar biosynthesis anti-sigma factor FlgM [Vagococcus sp. DIV0080]
MKINNQYSSYRDAYQTQMNQEQTVKDKSVIKKEPVQIDLSTTSQQIRFSDEVVDIDQSQKIANIKKAISEGTYDVSAKQIANKMFDQLKG